MGVADVDGLVDREPGPELGRRQLVLVLPVLGELLLLVRSLLGDELERGRVSSELLELEHESVELLEDDERLSSSERLSLGSVLSKRKVVSEPKS